ncbi:MAG TPA: iron-sulfur cluster assembly protein [Solirubrobacteraceae bacterium]|nr:iron-sulfur cluster assembly protein [Solirubrobacteraceae bacterium]
MTRERVIDALAEVYDPELDEPITRLGFVSSCEVSPDGDVDVALRLPTPQCAPNFAFLMAADARTAVCRLPLARRVTIRLEDHYTGDEINAAIAGGEGFTGAFPGETDDDELGALRELFQRKALTARQAAVCEAMLAGGVDVGDLTRTVVADLPDDASVRRCLELRCALGIESGPDAPAFVLPDGEPLTADQLPRWLRMARLVRTSLEANGGICRSLLQVRHDLATDSQEG